VNEWSKVNGFLNKQTHARWVPVTMVWHSLRFQMEELAFSYGSSGQLTRGGPTA